jgi:hypothetical protein
LDCKLIVSSCARNLQKVTELTNNVAFKLLVLVLVVGFANLPSYNTFWFIGGIPGTFIPYGTSTIAGTNSWRIPIWLQMMFSGVVLVFSLWLPEVSPNFLARKLTHSPGKFPDTEMAHSQWPHRRSPRYYGQVPW